MKIKVQSKDGRVWDINPENLEKAYSRGAILVDEEQKIKVKSKDGKVWDIKVKNIPIAFKRGATILDKQDVDIDQEPSPSFLDRIGQFGKGALAGFMRSGLAEGADQFGAGVMEVAPGVAVPILPQSAQVMAKSANKGLEALESMRPDEKDKWGNVLYHSGEFVGGTAAVPGMPGANIPSSIISLGGKSLLKNFTRIPGVQATGKFTLDSFKKIPKGEFLLNNFNKASQGVSKVIDIAAPEAITGGISGALQAYGNVDPFTADLMAGGARVMSPSARTAVDSFSKTKRGEKKVSALLKNTTKEKNLDNLMNFNPEGLDVIPTTAEVALHPDISNLHNTYAPTLTDIQLKQAYNNKILRKKLDDIGNNLNPNNIELGNATRELIDKNLTNLEKIRSRKSAPYYEALKQENYYPVENFKNSIKEDLPNTTWETNKTLKQTLKELEKNNKEVLEPLKKELSLLQEKYKTNLDLNSLPPKIQEKLLLKEPALGRIEELKNKINFLEDKYKAVIIDNHIKQIKDKIQNNIENGKTSGNHILYKQVVALEKDLEATPGGLSHRKIYRKYSPKINQIEEDNLLSKFVKKKDSDFKEPVDKLADHIFSAPQESVKRYMAQVRGSNAENLTKAYGRKEYLGKMDDFEGGLPTYDKSSQFLKNKAAQMEAIYSPADLDVFKRINKYLQDKQKVQWGNSAFGSATNPKERITKNVKKYLGEENLTPYSAWGDFPLIRPIVKKIPFTERLRGITVPNQNYKIFERALTDPIYAKELMTRQNLRPNYFPTLYNVLTNNNN